MRAIGPKCRKCRREGEKLFLKGARCSTQKCGVIRRNTAPGANAKPKGQSKLSEFGKQLREKQKVKRAFGLSEKTLRLYYDRAVKLKGVAGDNFLIMLESRLDNAVYRAGFTESRDQARQLVSHGIFKLNGKRVDIPSIAVKEGDKISLRESSASNPIVGGLNERKVKPPRWIKVDYQKKEIEIVRLPDVEELEKSVSVSLIIEFYSR